MKRLFFALWPDEAIRQKCRKVTREVRGFGRPVATDNIHITLVFLGGVDEDNQTRMMQAAADIAFQPMTLSFDRLEYWKKPAVVCLGAERVDPAVLNLVEQLMAAAIQNGISVDRRPYKPHVTLLRKAKALDGEIKFEPIVWRADGFCLVESCSTPRGVEYRVMGRWQSGKSAD